MKYAIVSTNTYTNGWPEKTEMSDPFVNVHEARKALLRVCAAILANNDPAPTVTIDGWSLAVAPFKHFGASTERIVPDDRPDTVADPRPDDHKYRGVVCTDCGTQLTNWHARCFATDEEAMCCCCFYGDDPDDCSGIGGAYRPVR